MRIAGAARRVASTVIALGVAAGALVAGPTSAAQASIGTGRIQLCAQGNYAAYLTMSSPTGAWESVQSPDVAPGSCATWNIVRDSRYTVINVFGKYNTKSGSFWIYGLDTKPDLYGYKLAARGTTADGGRVVRLPNV
ncbi:hypothetical protein ACIBTV_12675 [Micromonospora sp. NPDC049366]|uniref:hypothetical protein n=1 Tax=Micromonospora sp. NPDC049366 TaxID=3364271 RepID=UPI0037AF2B34